jgi:GGDEF domain-containing protein
MKSFLDMSPDDLGFGASDLADLGIQKKPVATLPSPQELGFDEKDMEDLGIAPPRPTAPAAVAQPFEERSKISVDRPVNVGGFESIWRPPPTKVKLFKDLDQPALTFSEKITRHDAASPGASDVDVAGLKSRLLRLNNRLTELSASKAALEDQLVSEQMTLKRAFDAGRKRVPTRQLETKNSLNVINREIAAITDESNTIKSLIPIEERKIITPEQMPPVIRERRPSRTVDLGRQFKFTKTPDEFKAEEQQKIKEADIQFAKEQVVAPLPANAYAAAKAGVPLEQPAGPSFAGATQKFIETQRGVAGGAIEQAGKQLQQVSGTLDPERVERGRRIADEYGIKPTDFQGTTPGTRAINKFKKEFRKRLPGQEPLQSEIEDLSAYGISIAEQKRTELGKTEEKFGKKQVKKSLEEYPVWVREMEGMDQVIALEKLDPGAFRALKRGDLGVFLDQQVANAAMTGDPDYIERMRALSKEFREVYGQQDTEEKKAGALKYYGAKSIEIIGPMLKSLAIEAPANLIPGTGPARVARTLGAAGSTYFWIKQGAGDVYQTLRDEGVSHEVALPAAWGGAIPFALTERAQIKAFVDPGVRRMVSESLGKYIAKQIARKGLDLAKEGLWEETAQQWINDGSAINAFKQAGLSDKAADLAAQQFQRGIKTGAQAMITFAPLNLFGLAHGAIRYTPKQFKGEEEKDIGRDFREGAGKKQEISVFEQKPPAPTIPETAPASAPTIPETAPASAPTIPETAPASAPGPQPVQAQAPAPTLPVPKPGQASTAGSAEITDFGVKDPGEYWKLPDERREEIWPQLNSVAQDQLLSYEEPLQKRPVKPAEAPAVPVVQPPIEQSAAAPADVAGLNFDEYSKLPPEQQRQAFETMQKENLANPVTGVPGQRAFNISFIKATNNGKQQVSVAIGDLNGLKEYNDVLTGMDKANQVLKAAYDFVAEQIPEATITKTHLHGDEYAVIAPGMTPQELQAMISTAMQNFAREVRIEHEGFVYRPTMTWAVGQASTAGEVGALNPKKMDKNAIGIDKGDGKYYDIKVGAPDVKPQEIVKRGIHGENLRQRDLGKGQGNVEGPGQRTLAEQNAGQAVYQGQGGPSPAAETRPEVTPAPPPAPAQATAIPELSDREKSRINKLINSGFVNLTKIRRGKKEYYHLYDKKGNERVYLANSPHAFYIRDKIKEQPPAPQEKQKQAPAPQPEPPAAPAGIHERREKAKKKFAELQKKRLEREGAPPAMLKPEESEERARANSIEELEDIVHGTMDEVLDRLPEGLGDRIRVNFGRSFDYRGRKWGENGDWEMAVWYDPDNKVVEIYINPDTPADRIATGLNHELPGHIGSRLVYADNPEIYKKMRAFYEQQGAANEPFLEKIKTRYRAEMEMVPDRKDEILFDEWSAHHLQRYLDQHARDNVATRIYNYFRGMLIKLGVVREKIDDVLGEMVRKMRGANLESLGAPQTAFAKEETALTEEEPEFLKSEEGPADAEREEWLEQRRENAKHQAEVDQARAAEITKIKNRLSGTLRHLPDERMNERADIELQVKNLEIERMDLVKNAIYAYARALGLNGVPYNQVDTMLKNARTAADLNKAIARLDKIWQAVARRSAVENLYELVEKKYKRLQAIKQGKVKSTLSAEANDRLEQYLNQLIKSPEENKDQINKMLAAFNYYGRKEAKSADYITDMREDVKSWLADPTTDVPESIKNAIHQLFAPAIEQMSMDEITEARANIESIEQTGRTVNEIKDETAKREIEEAAAKIANQVEATSKKKSKTDLEEALEPKAKTKIEYFANLLKDNFWGLIDPERMVEWLAGWKNTSLIKSKLLAPIYKAEAEKITNTKRVIDRFQKIHEKLKISETFNKPVLKINVERLDEDGTVKDEKEYGLTLDNMMFVYANSKNPGNLAHLVGTGLTTEHVAIITKHLPQDYKDAVDEMIQYFDTEQYPRMNEIFRDEHEVNMPRVDNYFPIQNLKTDKAESAIVADYLARFGSRWAGVQKGMTKSRVLSQAPFKDMSYFSAVIRNLTQTEHYIAYNRAVRSVQRYLNNKQLKDAIQAKDERVYRQLRDWLKAVAYGRVSGSENPVDKTADLLRRQFVTYVLGLKLTTGLQQLSSFAKGAGMIDKGMVLRSTAAFSRNPVKALEFANEKSAIMRVRMQNYERELAEMAEKALVKEATGTTGVMKKIKSAAMWHIGAIDKAVATVLWNAKYEEVRHSGADEQSAIDAADEVIRKTQSRGGVVFMPSLYRGGGLVRAYTMFTSDINQNLNLLFELAGKWGMQKTRENAAQVFWYFVLPTFMVYIVNNAFHPDRPEEMVKTLVNQFTGGIPFWGQLIDALLASAADEVTELRGIIPNKNWKRWTSDISPTSMQPILTAIQAAAELNPAMVWDAAMQLAGMPWNAVKRTIKGGETAWETKDIRYLIWPAAVIKEQSVRESMARRALSPRPGTDDRERFGKWYRELDPGSKNEFREYLKDFAARRAEEKAEKTRKQAESTQRK